MNQRPPITILLVDDHPVVRQGLATMLSDHDDLAVVAEADDGEQAVALFIRHKPDVTLVDLSLPKLNGVQVIQQVRKQFPGARFIVVTTYENDPDIVRAVQAGARAVLMKVSPGAQILETIRAIHAGEQRIPAPVAARLADSAQQPDLSPREREVLQLIARGDSNKDVGSKLAISEGTVKSHVVKIFFKLGVSDRTAATTVAVQRGIIKL